MVFTYVTDSLSVVELELARTLPVQDAALELQDLHVDVSERVVEEQVHLDLHVGPQQARDEVVLVAARDHEDRAS